MLHVLKIHEVTPHSRLVAIVLFLAIVPALAFYTGMQYAETVRIVSEDPITLTLVPVRHETMHVPGTAEYQGAWFSVRFPETFAVATSGADEIAVVSQDREAEFYAYAPQWIGDTPYLDQREGEELVSDEIVELVEDDPATLYPAVSRRYLHYRALDGSYERRVVSEKRGFTQNDTVTHRVFGFSYRDAAALAAYRDAYDAFRDSLVERR